MAPDLPVTHEALASRSAGRLLARVHTAGRPRSRSCLYAILPGLIALVLGSIEAIAERDRALDPDVLEFQALAQQMTPDTVFGGVREPIWPVLFVLPVHLLGDHSALALRLIGVLGFVFLIVAFQLVARQMFGQAWAVTGALVLALTPWLVFQAARGLREETSAGVLLVLCLGLLRPKISGPRFVLLFALVGISGLLRWDTLVLSIPALGVALLIHRPHPLAWIAGPAVLALIVLPLLLANYAEHGDPMYHSNIHASFYRNVEFHDRPGFVTSAQMAQDAFAGPATTWTHYVFGLHSPTELLRRAAVATFSIPFDLTTDALFLTTRRYPVEVPRLVSDARTIFSDSVPLVVWPLWAAGGLLLLRTRAWPVPFILGEILIVYSPIASVVDPRLVLPAMPLMLLCAMKAVQPETWTPALRTARVRYTERFGGLKLSTR